MSKGRGKAENFMRHLEPLQGALEAYCRRSLHDPNATGYTWALERAVRGRWLVVLASLVLLAASLLLYPFIGQELFPATDANQIVINVRLPAGTRIEKTQEWISGETEVVEGGVKRKQKTGKGLEDVVMAVIPEADRQLILSDMGVLYDWPAGYTANAGPMDATILIQLTDWHRRSTISQEYANRLRQALAADPTEYSILQIHCNCSIDTADRTDTAFPREGVWPMVRRKFTRLGLQGGLLAGLFWAVGCTAPQELDQPGLPQVQASEEAQQPQHAEDTQLPRAFPSEEIHLIDLTTALRLAGANNL